MKKLITVCCMLCFTHVYAQDNNVTDKKQIIPAIKFHSTVQFGLLEGEAPSAFQIQTINGIQYKTWYAGIGVGIDNYKFRTIPLFADIQKNILNKPITPYVFTDIGIQFPWLRNDQKSQIAQSNFNNGFYFNFGAGYKINLIKNNALLFNTAFSLKQFSNNYSTIYPCDFGPCSEQDYSQHFKYTLRRLSLQIGWLF